MAGQRDDNKGPDRDSDRSFFRFPRGGGLFILILLLGFMVMQILTPQGNSSSELTYNQFLTLMSDPSAKIKSLSILKSVDGVELRGKRELDSKE